MNNKLAGMMAGLLVLALALIAMLWLAQARRAGPVGVKHEMTNLAAGLAFYHAVFESFPTGNNAQIIGALRGKNPRKMMIDPTGPRRMNLRAELWDIWNTPYNFDFASNSIITILSAGENQKLGDADDLVVRVSLSDTNFPFWKVPLLLTNTPPQP
jgi:hypothetical protein